MDKQFVVSVVITMHEQTSSEKAGYENHYDAAVDFVGSCKAAISAMLAYKGESRISIQDMNDKDSALNRCIVISSNGQIK